MSKRNGNWFSKLKIQTTTNLWGPLICFVFIQLPCNEAKFNWSDFPWDSKVETCNNLSMPNIKLELRYVSVKVKNTNNNKVARAFHQFSFYTNLSSPSRSQNLLQMCSSLNLLIASDERFPQQKRIELSSLSRSSEVAISGSHRVQSTPWMSTTISCLPDLA